ncbi:MAG TPA: peptidoglycan DD-metalloendopeptidase family protein [Pyrinomonadaceae bacterium]|jgi:murein DD-endopeptidase MepM/ murein hydrolase activator NlpD|nr:peptidoglycan DD-metalloendopeptidase family protein [Pyrinomonadaceae bacterium]
MTRDDRLYAFIVARTSRSRSKIRRISIHKRWLKAATALLCFVLCVALYGLYGMFRVAQHLKIEQENTRLRVENEKQRRQLEKLENRVDAIEDTSRRIAEISGAPVEDEGATKQGTSERGAGGPLVEMDAAAIAAVETRAAELEQELRAYESALRERARIPSIWPVAGGEVTDSFGGRRDPFGGGSPEFHSGQDISAERGTPVYAAGIATVKFAGTQGGYGQIVILDHGDGITTRYGHLSKIEVGAGQQLTRGEMIGRVGSTGRSTGPHLHYEVRINEEPVNPRAYLPAPGKTRDHVTCAQP